MPIPSVSHQSLPEKIFLYLAACSKSLALGNYLLKFSFLMRRAAEPLLFKDGRHIKHLYLDYFNWFSTHINLSDTVLDIGSGNGQLSEHISNSCKFVVAVEISPRLYNYSRKILRNRDNINFVNDCIFNFLKYNTTSFDVVILSNVLEHLQDRSSLLQALKKLKCSLLIRVPDAERDWANLYLNDIKSVWISDYTHQIEHNSYELEHELVSAGFTLVSLDSRFGELYVCCE